MDHVALGMGEIRMHAIQKGIVDSAAYHRAHYGKITFEPHWMKSENVRIETALHGPKKRPS